QLKRLTSGILWSSMVTWSGPGQGRASTQLALACGSAEYLAWHCAPSSSSSKLRLTAACRRSQSARSRLRDVAIVLADGASIANQAAPSRAIRIRLTTVGIDTHERGVALLMKAVLARAATSLEEHASATLLAIRVGFAQCGNAAPHGFAEACGSADFL